MTRIREKLEPSTQRKKDIVKAQLERRYSALNASYTPGAKSLNLLKVIRWFNEQGESYRRLVANEDPAPWLQHLHGKERHSQWHLTALIVERYMQVSDPRFVFPAAVHDIASDTSSSVSAPLVQRGMARPISVHSKDQSSMRRKSDDRLSFEPLVRSRRGSADATSSRASADAQSRRWRNSLGATEERESLEQNEGRRSRRQTTSSDQHKSRSGHGSPLTRRSLQTFGVKKRSLQSLANSDVDKSSGGEMRERSDTRNRHPSDPKRSRFHLSLDLRSAQSPIDDEKHHRMPSFTLADLRTDVNASSNASKKSQTLPTPHLDASISQETFDRPQKAHTVDSGLKMTPIKTLNAPAQRLLPPPLPSATSRAFRLRKRSEAQERALNTEYRKKKELVVSHLFSSCLTDVKCNVFSEH